MTIVPQRCQDLNSRNSNTHKVWLSPRDQERWFIEKTYTFNILVYGPQIQVAPRHLK